jgi:hypothetical protein
MTVFARTGGYRGCVVASARGWKAHDATDALLGYFPTQHDAAAALLERASGTST